MTIYIVRHGETTFNAAKIFQFPDTPLSDRGQAQAAKVALRLADKGITAIYTSHYSRARSTAEAIAGTTGAPLEVNEILCERNFGSIRGLAHTEVADSPHAPDFIPPNGESWPEFHQRVAIAWDAIKAKAARTEGHLAVVTHGLVCASLAQEQFKLNPGKDMPAHWPNTAVTIVDGDAPWNVTLAGCGAHLDTPDVQDSGNLSGT